MSCLNKSKAVLLASILNYVIAHRTRAHVGLRGSSARKPTHHPTYSDWAYLNESTGNIYQYPTMSPTYDYYPTLVPTKDEHLDTYHPTAGSEDSMSQDSDGERELPNNEIKHGNNIPTHHPTFPDWGYMYETSAQYPTTFPTYSDHDKDYFGHYTDGSTSEPTRHPSNVDSNEPTVFDWNYNSPTYLPTTVEEAQRKKCEVGTFFQLDIALDYDGHDITWNLLKLPDEVIYQGNEYKDGLVYDNIAEGCLESGDYEFTIHDSGGDGIQDPGYYSLKLCKGSCQMIAGGNDFGYNETTSFTILSDSETVIPTSQPTLPWSNPPRIVFPPSPTASDVSIEGTSKDSLFVDPFKAPASSLGNVEIPHNLENWVAIIDENFENGFGYFLDEDTTAVLYETFEDKLGVIAIQDGPDSEKSSLVSKTIELGESIGDDMIHSKFKVVFSYYASKMESFDGFCFDYSIDGGSSWKSEQCWHKDEDFDNDMWNVDTVIIFEPEFARSITLRFRCNSTSSSDAVMIDKMQLSDLHD